MTRPGTVFLADDHEMILPGIGMIIESRGGFEVSGQATDCLAAYGGIRDGKISARTPTSWGIEAVASDR